MNAERIEQIIKELKEHKRQIKKVLRDNGYNSMPSTFQELIEELNEMYVLNPNLKHNVALLNEDGYVTEIIEINAHQVYKGEIPEDLGLHYYKLKDGVLVLDEKLKEQTHSLE